MISFTLRFCPQLLVFYSTNFNSGNNLIITSSMFILVPTSTHRDQKTSPSSNLHSSFSLLSKYSWGSHYCHLDLTHYYYVLDFRSSPLGPLSTNDVSPYYTCYRNSVLWVATSILPPSLITELRSSLSQCCPISVLIYSTNISVLGFFEGLSNAIIILFKKVV